MFVYGKTGIPGKGGNGGMKGENGKDGISICGKLLVKHGEEAQNGRIGADGREGLVMPSAKIYINNEVVSY